MTTSTLFRTSVVWKFHRRVKYNDHLQKEYVSILIFNYMNAIPRRFSLHVPIHAKYVEEIQLATIIKCEWTFTEFEWIRKFLLEVSSCNGCKSFFRRTIIENRIFECLFDNDCLIPKQSEILSLFNSFYSSGFQYIKSRNDESVEHVDSENASKWEWTLSVRLHLLDVLW